MLAVDCYCGRCGFSQLSGMASDALSLLVGLPLVKVGGSSNVTNAAKNQIQMVAPIDAHIVFVEPLNQGN